MKKSLSYLCVAVITGCLPLIGCGPARTAQPATNSTVPTPRVSSVTPAADTYRVAPELSQRVAQIPGISNAVTLVNGNIAYVVIDTVNPPGTTGGAAGRTIAGNSVARDGSTQAGVRNNVAGNAAARTGGTGFRDGSSGVVTGVGNAVGGVVTGVGNITGRALSGVGNVAGNVFSGTGRTIGGPGTAIGNTVGGTLSGAGNLAGGVATGVGNVAGGVAAGVGNAAGAVVSGIGNAASAVTGANQNPNAAPGAYTNTTTYVNPRTQPRPDRYGTYVADHRGMVRSALDRQTAPDRPQVYRSAGIDPRLQQRVSDTVKSANPSIMYVYVTDDPNALAQLQSTATTASTDYRPLIDRIFPSAR